MVQPHAPARALALVERLAHERVREHEAVGVVGDLAHEPGLVRLLERGDDPLDRLVEQRLEHLQPELAADHRRGGEHCRGGVGEAREARADELPSRPRARGRGGACRRVSSERVGEAAQRLLDEERVAVGALLQPQR